MRDSCVIRQWFLSPTPRKIGQFLDAQARTNPICAWFVSDSCVIGCVTDPLGRCDNYVVADEGVFWCELWCNNVSTSALAPHVSVSCLFVGSWTLAFQDCLCVFVWGEGEGVGSDYMCTGHAVWPACRVVMPTLCHSCTKEDFMLIIGQVRQSELLPTISFFPITVRSTQIIFKIKHTC